MKIVILSMLLAFTANAKTIRVAVIDSGIDKEVVDLSGKYGANWKHKGMCPTGHKDFTGFSLHDYHGHGTNISGLIHRYAKGKDYCQIIIKYTNGTADKGPDKSFIRFIKALQHAINLDVDFINISGGGSAFNKEEKALVKKAIDKGITIVAGAGNDNVFMLSKEERDTVLGQLKKEIAKQRQTSTKKKKLFNIVKNSGHFYPAMYYPEVVVVSAVDNHGNRARFANYGKKYVDVYERGVNMYGEYGPMMSGTSQSTAVHTGKLVRDYINLSEIERQLEMGE